MVQWCKGCDSLLPLKFHRNDIQGTGDDGWKNRGGDGLNLIAPYEDFYNTDGFGVRPVSTKRPELP